MARFCVLLSAFIFLGHLIETSRGNTTTSNPFRRGCLTAKMPGWENKKIRRVCNSEDTPQAILEGVCSPPSANFLYKEVRISSENWDTAFFVTWILQILLSEVLHVPSSVETGTSEAQMNFYDPESRYELSLTSGNDFERLRKATELGDCRLASRDPNNYEQCAHVIPEVWEYDFTPEWKAMAKQGIIDVPHGLGALIQEGWFVPRFVAERDPSILTYLGLQGEKNRQKLAEMFLRPTTWKQYCDEVSENGCETADDVAQRPPQENRTTSQGEDEPDRMFVEGLYKGHFRGTEKNDCGTNANCSGHIVDYPCGWASYIVPQTYHLNISLESDGNEPLSNGYSFSQMNEIWYAANATKSNVMMIWWTSEGLYPTFLGSDAEFVKIGLPPPTQECIDTRISTPDRCVEDFETRIGDPKGACDEAPQSLKVAISTGLRDDDTTLSSDALQSPGYQTVRRFAISELQMNQLWEKVLQMSSPREAVCQWVVDNFESLQEFIPQTYPRVIQEGEDNDALLYASLTMATIATVVVIVTALLVFRYRTHQVMKFSQVDFLYLLLTGALFVSIGSILIAAPPSNASCAAAPWMINLGYTLELVPLIVKVAAINKLMEAAKKMRRVVIQRKSLFAAVMVVCALVALFLAVWTALDPPHKEAAYDLTDVSAEGGETIVTVRYYCNSESDVWYYISVGWSVLLLLIACIMAFQMRHIRQDFNESQILSILIYSHFVFVLLRLVIIFLSSSFSGSVLARAQSLILSLDTTAMVIIYFVPKFLALANADGGRSQRENNTPRQLCKQCGGEGYEKVPTNVALNST